ncbi:hypothetical protein BH24CHL4_BH24CHL4_02650 [soil metagenome]
MPNEPAPDSFRYELAHGTISVTTDGRTSRNTHNAFSIGFGILDQAFISAAGFLIILLIARYSSVNELGRFSLAMAAIYFAASIQNSLIIAPHAVLAAPLPDSQFQEATSSGLLAQLVLCGASSLFMLMLALCSRAFTNSLTSVFVIAAFAAATLQLQEFFRRVLYCKLHTGMAFANNLVNFAILSLLVATAAATDRLNSVTSLGALAIAAAVAASIGAIQIRGSVSLSVSVEHVFHWWRSAWTIGSWLVASSLLGWATTSLFPFFLAGFVGLAEVAVLRAAQSLLGLSNIIFRFLDATMLPRAASVFAERGKTGLNRFLRRTWLLILPVFLIVLVFSVLLGETVMARLFGSSFVEDAWILIPLSIALLLTSVSSVLGMGLKAMHQTSSQFYAYLAASLINITMGLLIVWRFGLEGAAVGVVLSNAAIFIVSWYYFILLTDPVTLRLGSQQSRE